MEKWSELKRVIDESGKICIISHPSPDGDSIGSSLGLYWYFRDKGLEAQVITPDPPPEYLNFLEGFEAIIYPEKYNDKVIEELSTTEVLFCLDFNQLARLKGLEEYILNNSRVFIVNIDHHQNPENFANASLCDVQASSTAELIYQFITELEGTFELNKVIASSLYTGIVTDTGSFKFPSTTTYTHFVASKLLETGIKHSEIHQKVFDNYSKDRLKLIGFALNERLIFHNEFSTAIIYLSESDLNKFNYVKGDTEGLVNYPLSVASINFAILITEYEGKVKLSFRSKGKFQVNEFSKKYFNGGGHINAAGGISDLSIMETIDKIEKLLPSYKDEILD